MLKVQSFTFNPFQENTYIISNALNHCWIVDPGMFDTAETNALTNYINSNQLIPKAIINTHAHIDHILGVQALVDAYKIPFSLHRSDTPVLNSALASAAMFGLPLAAVPQPDTYIDETKPLILGGDKLQVLFTPGHSPGSITFYYPEGRWAIAGDVLFSGSIGRTDLPGGDFNTLINSIRTQLFTLPADTTIFPGHGPSTTIDAEKKYNPFLRP
jgi:glyoxylase-like metal-dependent hydrolase (beta-lactamase superfamily II)